MDKYEWPEPQKLAAFPVAEPGVTPITVGAFVSLLFALTGSFAATLVSILATAFLVQFFRDPDRAVPQGEGEVVSPADGVVVEVQTIDAAPFLEGDRLKIGVFMNVFNVHVNRFPFEGTVSDIDYRPGKLLKANVPEASLENERNALYVKTETGAVYCVVQIAGLIARRIMCTVKTGDSLARGRRFGMICLGSRVDLYLPVSAVPRVSKGEKVKAGVSVLAHMPNSEEDG